MAAIHVSNLNKSFKTYKKEPGLGGSIRSLFNRKHETKTAVNNISFDIEEGEFVGFIGPNGAGKTTTLKCLSGLIYPTKGEVSVLGHDPFLRKPEFLKEISLVMGQKSQLWWDLPAPDTFLLNKEIYGISDSEYKKNIKELYELLQVEEFVNTPVRGLSLGQRMKCELIASLIHQPKILFLDEPTIGLDVVMQKNLREFIRDYNQKFNATIILTSHYMEDVRQLCKRVIIIDHGIIIFDGALEDIIKEYSTEKTITVLFEKEVKREDLKSFGEITSYEDNRVVIEVPVDKSNLIAAKLLNDFPVEDLNIEEADLDEIIRTIFNKNKIAYDKDNSHI